MSPKMHQVYTQTTYQLQFHPSREMVCSCVFCEFGLKRRQKQFLKACWISFSLTIQESSSFFIHLISFLAFLCLTLLKKQEEDESPISSHLHLALYFQYKYFGEVSSSKAFRTDFSLFGWFCFAISLCFFDSDFVRPSQTI